MKLFLLLAFICTVHATPDSSNRLLAVANLNSAEEEVSFDWAAGLLQFVAPHLMNLLNDENFKQLAADVGINLAKMILENLGMAVGIALENSGPGYQPPSGPSGGPPMGGGGPGGRPPMSGPVGRFFHKLNRKYRKRAEMQVAEEEEVEFLNLNPIDIFAFMLPHLRNLLHDPRFQELAMSAGTSVAEMILDHLGMALGVDNNNSDSVNDFYGRMEAAYSKKRKGKRKSEEEVARPTRNYTWYCNFLARLRIQYCSPKYYKGRAEEKQKCIARYTNEHKCQNMEFALAEEEENSEPLSVAIHILVMLASNPLVQKLAIEAGIGIFKFILEHAKAALDSNGDAKKFRNILRKKSRKRKHESFESELAELEERLAFAPAYGEEFEELIAGYTP